MEKIASYHWQGSTFAKTMLHPEILPRLLSPPLMAHLNTQGHLLQAWLGHLESSGGMSSKITSFSFSDFSKENMLIKAAFEVDKSLFSEEKQKLVNFCMLLQRQSQIDSRGKQIEALSSLFTTTKQQIAKLIFLADRDLSATSALVNMEDIAGSLVRIRAAFDFYVHENLKKHVEHASLHDKVPLQNSAMAQIRNRSKIIADMLLTSSGHLNLGLVEVIKRQFFNEKCLFRREQELLTTLDILSGSSAMQNKFQNIKEPFSPFLLSNNIIRASLKLSPQVSINERHTKLVVLEALLSDFSQGEVGNCLGMCVAVMMMDALKERVLDDLISLASVGKLTREVCGTKKVFLPVARMENNGLLAVVTIENSGKVVSGKDFVWEAPGIVEAYRQMGIEGEDVEHTVKKVIRDFYEIKNMSLNELLEITPKELIVPTLKERTENFSKAEQRDLKNRVFLAFDNEIHCPLICAWESCFASMTEAASNNKMREKITRAISAVIDLQWSKSFALFSKDAAKERVKHIFSNVLNDSIQLRYQPHAFIQPLSQSQGRSRILGALVLDELKQGRNSLMSKSIETPDQFKKFVVNQLQKTRKILISAQEEALERQLQMLDRVIAYVLRDDVLASSFTKATIRNYDFENSTISDPLAVWENLEHLPFRDVLKSPGVGAYTQALAVTPGQPQTVRPKNAEELLKAFFTFIKEYDFTNSYVATDNSYPNYIEKTMQHTFKLTPEYLRLKALNSEETTEEWIEQHFILPGKVVAQQPATEVLRNKFKDAICTQLLDKEVALAFVEAANKIAPEYHSLAEYGGELFKLVLGMIPQSTLSSSRAESILLKDMTKILFDDVLSVEDRAAIMDSAIRLADISWKEGDTHSLSLACFYNPLIQAVHLALVDKTGTYLFPLKQEEWVAYIPWELYGVKYKN